jgi:hypothetical protein
MYLLFAPDFLLSLAEGEFRARLEQPRREAMPLRKKDLPARLKLGLPERAIQSEPSRASKQVRDRGIK